MRILVFLLLLCFFQQAYAYDYFVYSVPSFLIPPDGTVHGNFEFSFDGYTEKDFLVRPVVSFGRVEILDPDIETWVDGTDTWLRMPRLRREFSVRLNSSEALTLKFLVQDTTTGAIYETNKHQLWTRTKYKPYLKHLNQNVYEYTPAISNVEPPEIKRLPKEQENLISKVIKYLSELF